MNSPMNDEELQEALVCDSCEGDGKEHCSNPDHAFVAGMGTEEMQRLGCPTCDYPRSTVVIRGGSCEDCNGSSLKSSLKIDDLLQLIKSRDQQIALAARLDEWAIVRGNWHGTDDTEFALLMNERLATLKQPQGVSDNEQSKKG